jgi:hypothetical protein
MKTSLYLIALIFFLSACYEEQAVRKINYDYGENSSVITHNDSIMYKDCPKLLELNSCIDESCIQDGDSRKLYDKWKTYFKNRYNIDENYFQSHIFLNDIHFISDTKHEYTIWYCFYVFKFGWLTLFRHSEVRIDSMPYKFPSDSLINFEFKLSNPPYETFKFDRIISYDEIQYLAKITYHGMTFKYDFCHIAFDEKTGFPSLYGSAKYIYDPFKEIFSKINLYDGSIIFYE